MVNAAFALFGNQGECKIEDLTSDKKFCTAMYHNGIWEKRKTHVGEFVHCIAPITIPYLKEVCSPSFVFALPKPPVGIYTEVLRFFRDIYNNIKSEVYVGVFWDLEKKDYVLYVPSQEVAGASITYDRKNGPFIDANLVHVMDIHSHANFGAGFSGTDTADEVSTKLFGVIGNVLGNVSMAWRAGCNQKFVTMSFDDVFDKESDKTYSVGHEAVLRVKEKPRVIYAPPARPVYVAGNTNVKPNIVKPYVPSNDASMHMFGDIYGDYDAYLTSMYENTIEFDSPINVQTWASPEYKEGVDDFITVMASWLDDVNGNICEGSSNRLLVSQFFDMINSCDQLDVDFLKYVLNDIVNYATVNEFHELIEHMNGLV